MQQIKLSAKLVGQIKDAMSEWFESDEVADLIDEAIEETLEGNGLDPTARDDDQDLEDEAFPMGERTVMDVLTEWINENRSR